MNYSDVQSIAKNTMIYAAERIHAGMNLHEVRALCEKKLLELGADSFWYWDVGAFVFAGDETTASVSGKDYQTSDRLIHNHDLVTIDLSPQCGDVWGDYARTFVVQNGKVVSTHEIQNTEWKNGLLAELFLHEQMQEFVTPQTTFEELYYYMNRVIEDMGYINLDFLGNLGHSIAPKKEDRIYIEKGNTACLGDVNYFTFEPHISLPMSDYGYKHENIYCFNHGVLREL